MAAHRRQLAEDQFKVGRIVTHRTSPHNVLEVWEDGHELREIVRCSEPHLCTFWGYFFSSE